MPFHVKAPLALTLLCASLAGCLPPPKPMVVAAPTEAELQAQAARKAARRARWLGALSAFAEDDRSAKREPYKLDCHTDMYGTTTCRENEDDARRFRCNTDMYGNTRCEDVR